MSAPPHKRSRLRTAAWAFGLLGGAALAFALALVLLPRVPAARSFVRVALEQLLDDVLQGDVQLGRITELSLGGVRVEGVTVHDAEGRTVLHAPVLSLGLDPLALLHLKLRFTHGLLEDANIRAIESESMAITLFEALAPPPSSAPRASDQDGLSLDIAFEHIHVIRARFYGDVPGFQNLEVVDLDVRGDIRVVDGELAVRVSQANGKAIQPFSRALSIDHATFALDTAPLRMWAKARLSQGDDRLRLALAYRLPEAGDDHLTLLVALDPLSSDLLIDIGVQPAQILLSTIRGHVRLHGPLRELAFEAALQTDAGELAVRGRMPESGTELRIASPRLDLAQLIAYAPPLTLGGHLDVGSDAQGRVTLRLEAPTLSLYDVELNNADIRGVYEDQRLTIQDGELRFAGGRFDVTGWVDAEADLSLRIRSRIPEVARDRVIRRTGLRGGLRTDVRLEKRQEQLSLEGSIGILGFGLDALSAKEIVLEGRATADDELERIHINVEGASWGTAYHGYKIGDIVFKARGTSPKLIANFELLDFHGRSATARVALTHRDDTYHVVFSPLQLGVEGREPWRAKADLTFTPDGIAFNQVFLANGPQRLDLSGAYSYSKEYRVDATLESFDLGGLRELTGVDLADLDGVVDGELALTGVPGKPRIEARGSLHSGTFLGMEDLALQLKLLSFENTFDIEAELVLPDSSHIALYAGGEPGQGRDWITQVAHGNYRFGIDFEDVPFDVATPWLGWLGIVPPPGHLSATVRGAGTLQDPYLELTSKVEGLVLAPFPKLDLSIDAVHDRGRISLREFTASDEHGEIATVEGFLDARLEELADIESLQKSLDTRDLGLSVAWKDRRLDRLPEPIRIDVPVPSTGSLHVAQTSQGPSIELRTSLGWSAEGEGLDACGAQRHPKLELTARAHDQHIAAKVAFALDGEQLALADLDAEVPVAAWLTGERPLHLPRTSFTLNAATAATEEVPGLCEYLAGPLRLEVSALDAFADPPELRFEVSSAGLQLVSHESQRYRLGALRKARTTGRPFALRGSGGVEGHSFTFVGTLDQGDSSSLRVEASLPRAALGGSALPRSEWPDARAHITAKQLELAPLLIALPGGLRGSGQLEGGAELRYDFGQDDVTMSGALWLSDGTLSIAPLGQELSQVSGRMILRDNTIRLEALEARDFDGRIAVSGELTLRGLEELESDLAISLRDFPIRRESAQVSRLTGSMALRASTTPERTRAELEFGELRVILPNDLGQGLQPLGPHPDIFVRGTEPPPRDPDPYAFELRVLAQRPPFRVLRSDLSAEVAADITMRYRPPELSLQGAAEIKRGSFELYGKRFELGESRLAFDGGDDIDPLVSIEATHRTPGGDIGVRVEGRVSDPTISFSHSNPDITETGAIIAQLLGARSNDPARQNQNASGAAAGILAGATAGLVTQEVRDELGGALPVLSVESNSQTLRSARIRAGVQLDQLIERRLGPLRHVVRGAYIEGFVAPGATDPTLDASTVPQSRGGGLLELRFPKDLVGTIEYRPTQNWRLDLAWEP